MDSDEEFTLVEAPAAKATKGRAKKANGKAPSKASAGGRKVLKEISQNRKRARDSEDEGSDYEDDEMDVEEARDDRSIEQIYQKKTQLEHILLRPDTYVGSIEPVTQSMWVFDDEKKKMEQRKITFVPGLYKIFDEIIVNACDNKQRDKTMDTLRVDIDEEKGEISVWNNGKGIPVALHKEHHVYVPELIFGHLLTGSNFDDKKKKTTGGRNGYGAKLANIFSTKFIVETADSSVKKKYKQVFSNNMAKKDDPTITSWSRKDFTCITFQPDLARFKMSRLDSDIVALFKKRVYDVAGVTDKSLNVYLNKEKITIKSFPQYVDLYRPSTSTSEDAEEGEGAKKPESQVIFDKPDGRWQVGIGLSDDGFQQVSFVNGICTIKGGQHVNYIADQVVNKLVSVLKKKNKGEAVKPNYIKNHMTVYVAALIDNPAFDSQTKETLTTRPASFGSSFTLSDKFLKQIEKNGMVEKILSFAEYKQTAELRRKGGGGGKKSKLTGITKLDDANYAGTAKAQHCTLIITEGDSAKTNAIGGLSVVGRDYYGVFPLKGKLLNVREASHSQILKNEEIQNLVKILGLKYGQKYESTKGLRYGRLMIMADQDYDGSHIKGLVINFIHHFWPTLLKVDGFLQEFITPIVKCTKGRLVKSFFTVPEYEKWRQDNNNGRGWNIKYYKGLGTSTTQEFKHYFSDLGMHQIGFVYDGDHDADSIDMAFSKKRVDERKDWLRGYELGTHVNYNVERMPYSEFVNKELILFSMADNLRSIPSVVDGFKPSQRKVLFCCFKRNLKKEIKVAQLGGYVSEHSAYHHGEASLYGTIVNMAQDFVGSNNVNLLAPNGQFGTRLLGGKDAASPRYIFTNLEAVSRVIFDPLDNDVLTYLDEDGQSIEPEWYVPVIPMVLVNGSEGIGTGWSSSVPNYNPLDIIRVLRQKIDGQEMDALVPWYRGFTGPIERKASSRATDCQTFSVQGIYEVRDETTLIISELPVKTWTQSYKQFLETLMEAGTIKDFKENHTDSTVLFTITMAPETLRDLVNTTNGIIKKFKLETSISTSNMHLFDHKGQIQKYDGPHQILDEFYSIRLDFYDRRKQSMLTKMRDQITLLSNKVRFILSVIKGEIVVNNRKKNELLVELEEKGFDPISSRTKKAATEAPESSENDDSDSEEDEGENLSKAYDYLLSMKIWSLTKERVERLRKELQDLEQQYRDLDATTIEQLWLRDLDKLEQTIVEHEEKRRAVAQQSITASKAAKVRKRPAKKKAKGGDNDQDSDYELPKKVAKPRAKTKPKASSELDSKPAPKKAAAKTTKSKAKQPPAPKVEEEKEEDIEVLSLAERLARRAPTVTSAAVKKNVVELRSDDEDEAMIDEEESGASDDDVFAMKVSKKAVSRKAATNKPVLASKDVKKLKESATKKAPRKRAGAASTQATPPSKKQKCATTSAAASSGHEDSADSPASSTPIAARKNKRVRNRVVYDELSVSDDEVEILGTRKNNDRDDADDESEFSDDDVDSDEE